MVEARINSLEKDVREGRADQKKIGEKVAEIREKIFNGFSHQMEESHENTIHIKASIGVLNKSIDKINNRVFRTDEEILANCPFKKEYTEKIDRKLKLYFSAAIVFLTLLKYEKEIKLIIKNLIGGS